MLCPNNTKKYFWGRAERSRKRKYERWVEKTSFCVRRRKCINPFTPLACLHPVSKSQTSRLKQPFSQLFLFLSLFLSHSHLSYSSVIVLTRERLERERERERKGRRREREKGIKKKGTKAATRGKKMNPRCRLPQTHFLPVSPPLKSYSFFLSLPSFWSFCMSTLSVPYSYLQNAETTELSLSHDFETSQDLVVSPFFPLRENVGLGLDFFSFPDSGMRHGNRKMEKGSERMHEKWRSWVERGLQTVACSTLWNVSTTEWRGDEIWNSKLCNIFVPLHRLNIFHPSPSFSLSLSILMTQTDVSLNDSRLENPFFEKCALWEKMPEKWKL